MSLDDEVEYVLSKYDENPLAMARDIARGVSGLTEKDVSEIRSRLEDEELLESSDHGAGTRYDTTPDAKTALEGSSTEYQL